MRNIKIAVIALAFLPFASAASAQTANTGAAAPNEALIRQEIQETREAIDALKRGVVEETKNAREGLQQNAQAAKQNLKTEAESLRANLQNSLSAIKANTSLTPEEAKDAAIKAREEAKAALQQQAESVKQAVIKDREEFKNQFEAKKEEVKQRVETEKRELQTRLQTIKDERKKQAVVDIAEQIQKANISYLERLTTVLSNIEEILRGISSRADKAALDGKDVSLVRADISEAESLIIAVRNHINVQSGVAYPIAITDEANLRNDVSASRNRLHADLTVLKDEIKGVHESVKKAATDLVKIPLVNQESPITD